MKKHLSILLLYTRSSLFTVLALLAAMAAAQLAYYQAEIESIVARHTANTTAPISLEDTLDSAPLLLIFALAFLLIIVVLAIPGCRLGSRTDYTVARLSLDERTLYAWQTAYNAAILLLLWATELGTVLACIQIYAEALPAYVTPQSTFLAAYRSGLLHALLPLEDVFLWMRNLAVVAGLALATARVPICRRAGKIPFAVFIMAMTALFFPRPLGDPATDFLIAWPTAAVIATSLWLTFRKEEYDD